MDSSAERQQRIFNANRDIVEVAREIADATEAAPRARARPGLTAHLPGARVDTATRRRPLEHGEGSGQRLERGSDPTAAPYPSCSSRSTQNASRFIVSRAARTARLRGAQRACTPSGRRHSTPFDELAAHLLLAFEAVDDGARRPRARRRPNAIERLVSSFADVGEVQVPRRSARRRRTTRIHRARSTRTDTASSCLRTTKQFRLAGQRPIGAEHERLAVPRKAPGVPS